MEISAVFRDATNGSISDSDVGEKNTRVCVCMLELFFMRCRRTNRCRLCGPSKKGASNKIR